MRGRIARVAAMAVASGLAVTAALGATGVAQDEESMTFTVVERAATDLVIDLGDEGDSLGDQLVFGNDLYDAANAEVIGRDQGNCFRTNPGLAWECTWTNILADGSIVVQGPFYDDLRDSELAVTGGTGAYASASGTMTLHARNETGTELDFEFHLGEAPAA
jgi:hypothetical protein